MLTASVIVFAIAALGGVVLALHVLRDKFAPWALSLVHALLGATGLVLLLLAVLKGAGGSLATSALVVFIVAALGGFFLASVHYRKQLPPKGIVVLHALLAVTGFGLLLTAVLT
ncbi:MAG TPA: hypothetical protein PKK10_14755 [Woeseiaceae bacterium]|nr:hypothetical protein [Woeseiaceae bacterium]